MGRGIARFGVVAAFAALGCAPALAQDLAAACAALKSKPPAGMRIESADYQSAGPVAVPMMPAPFDTPEHCLVRGVLNERTGIDGKPYAIGFELRLPKDWNGRFYFQGGGGSDGVIRPAIGTLPLTIGNAVERGFAVASTDAGHKEEAGPLGGVAFGADPQARADYGHAALPAVTVAAKTLIAAAYGKPATKSYFFGCSNGGRQGMMATQRYPDLFDGVFAMAPANRFIRASIDVLGATQLFTAVAPNGPDGAPDFSQAFSAEEMKTFADAMLDACDAKDGLKDGMIHDIAACKFNPETVKCRAGRNSACVAPEKVDALVEMFKGSKTEKGAPVYAEWPWDPGIAAPGWRAWRLGTPGKRPYDARNITLVAPSIALVFSSPQDKIDDPYKYALAYRVARDADRGDIAGGQFTESAAAQMEATSTDLTKFKERGGKLMLVHGMADPIFSALDMLRYVGELRTRFGDETDGFTKSYVVPGMGHCAGGPATDQFDAMQAMIDWVEKGQAPDAIIATARATPDVPWPGRTRPLCPHPRKAVYKGQGDAEKAENFDCR